MKFTKEYRDKHWKACRYSTDPRTCGSCYIPKGDVDARKCDRDDADCDAKWEGINMEEEWEEEEEEWEEED